MAAEERLNAAAGGPRERRPAIWPWLLMPVIVLLVFAALLRMHHGTHWAGIWSHSNPRDESPQPAR
jgi:hypothetical protein